MRLRDSNLAKDEERHQQLKQEGEKQVLPYIWSLQHGCQEVACTERDTDWSHCISGFLAFVLYVQLETFERVKEKMTSPTTPFSLARQRLQRAHSGLGSSAPPATATTAAPAALLASAPITSAPPKPAPAAAAASPVGPPTSPPAKPGAPAAASTQSSSSSQPAVPRVAFPPPSRPRPQDRRQSQLPEAARGPPLVASPVVSLPSPDRSSPSGRTSPSPAAATPAAQEPASRQAPPKSAAGLTTPSSPFAAYDKAPGDRGGMLGAAAGAPPIPERSSVGRLPSGPMVSGRLPSGPMLSGRLPSSIPTQAAEPVEEPKPTHKRSLSRGRQGN